MKKSEYGYWDFLLLVVAAVFSVLAWSKSSCSAGQELNLLPAEEVLQRCAPECVGDGCTLDLLRLAQDQMLLLETLEDALDQELHTRQELEEQLKACQAAKALRQGR